MPGKIAIRAALIVAALTALALPSAAVAAPATGVQPQTIQVLPSKGDVQIQAKPILTYGGATSRLPVSFSASGACLAGDPFVVAYTIGLGGADGYAAPITLTGLGDCTVVASQPGDATYAPAPDATTTFRIVPPLMQAAIQRVPTRFRTPKNPPRRRHHRWVLEWSQPLATSFSCGLDGAAFTPCSSPAVFRNLAPGTHRFRVESFVHGVAAPDPSSIRFRVHGRPR